ncbi:unnamed protein product [Leuciscus chuanchicus]
MKLYILFSFLLLAVICSSSVDAQVKFGRLCSSSPSNRIRRCDRLGCGNYGAKRGNRKHLGLDIACTDGATVYAPFDVKLNGRSRPYGNKNAIDDGINLSGKGLCLKLFYVKPDRYTGTLKKGQRIGSMLPMQSVYRGITSHMPSCGSCRAPLAQGDKHIICVSCLGESHAALALADGGCPHCDLLPMVTLRTRLASFSESAFPAALPRRKKRRSQRAPEPAPTRPSSPVRPPASPASPVSLPDAQRPQSAAASSEEVVSEAASGEKDSCSLPASGSEDWASSEDLAPPARKPTTRANIEKELMRVLALAAESLGLEWSAPEPPSRTRLDGSFLPGERTSSESKPAPFLPELHEEVAKAWNAPFSARTRSSVSPAFSSLDNAKDRGYLSLPPVEQAIATHLCPPSAGRRTKPVLPSKACRMTSTLLARIFSAAGQAASALHTMATLQIFQGDLLRKLDEMGPEAICIADLRSASDLTLRATKSAAQAMGRCMASATVAERHLWLTLTEMADSERNAFLDAPLSSTGLFGSSLSEFVERFTEAQKASQAFKHFLPKRSGSAASREKQTPRSSQHQPPPSAASSQQRQQRQQHSSRSRSRSTGRPAQRGPRPRIVVKPEAPKKS